MEPTTQPVAAQVSIVLDKLNEIGHNIADGAKPLAERVVSEYATAHWLMAGAELALMVLGAIFVLLLVRNVNRLFGCLKSAPSTSDEPPIIFGIVVSIILAALFSVMGIVGACEALTDLGKAAAPTYHVLKSLF